MDVDGKGVVVTGAGRGIGLAIAARMAAEGARVVVNDLDDAAAQAVAASIGGHAVPGDAASETGVRDLIDAAEAQLDAIDIYFANAGLLNGTGLDTTEDDWARAIDINVMAHVRAARRLVPCWLESGGGRFVVTASAAGLLTALTNAPYAVSKHAAVAFAEWLAVTYGDRGITVQCICPLGVQTRMLDASGPMRELIVHDGALTPDEVAECVWEALGDDRFLILPHPEVREYYNHRATQTERWLAGMRKLRRRVDVAGGHRA